MAEAKRKRIENDEKTRPIVKSESTTIENAGKEHLADTNGDRRLPVDILPPELWEIIFKKVDSPKDLLKCWNTCSAWAAALRSTDFYFKMTLPLVLPYLVKGDLLQCSSVSKSWNATVDACILDAENVENFFESSLDVEQRPMLELSPEMMPDFITELGLSSQNECEEKVVAINPVAFRFVFVWLRLCRMMWLEREIAEQEEIDQFSLSRSNLLTCLYHYGHLIRHLHLYICVARATFHEELKLIRSCLKRTPNLRVLHIEASPGRNYDDQEKKELKLFTSYILKNPFPKLEHLKALEICNFTKRKEYALLANAYRHQLLRLKFLSPLVLKPNQRQNRFSCLQKIHYAFSISCEGVDFEAFVRSSQCPLKELTVEFWGDPGPKNCKKVKMAIDAVSGTLETLVLRFRTQGACLPGHTCKSDITNFKELRLLQLKVLQLTDFGYPSFHLLKRVCPALQILIVAPFESYGNERKVEAGSNFYCDLYSRHRFWSELAHIQCVDVECMFGPKYKLVRGGRKGVKKERIPRRILQICYTRSEYMQEHQVGVNEQTDDDDEYEDAPNVLVTRSKNFYLRI